MSESTVPFTPGSGLSLRAILRTVGINNVLDEVIELSDQSGTLITPVAERDLLSDLVLGSGLSGLPIIGFDAAIGARSAFPIYNSALPVTGPAGGNVAVSGNAGAVTTASAAGNLNSLNAAVTLILSTTLQSVLAFLNITVNVVGTFVFEASVDNTNFFSVPVKNIATGKWQSSLVNPTTASTGLYAFEGIGAIEYRVRVSAYTSGTTAGSLTAMAYPDILTPSMAGTGQAIPPEAIYIAGTDGVSLRGIGVKNANPLTTDYGAHIRSLFQQLPNAALPSHTLWMGASDTTNLQGLLVESAANPNLLVGLRQGANQLGINASNQAAIQNPPNLDAAISTLLANAKFPATAALADATANPTLTEMQTFPMGFNGTTWDRLKAGTVSVGDSSTALLGSNGVFTGAYENVKDYGAITISVFADQASAANGLEFDWSHDGVNTDSSSTTNIAASAGRAFNIAPRARFFRVVYTNGAVAQGVFRLGTVYHTTGSGLISRPFSQTLDQDNYAQQVRAVLDGFDGTLFRHVGARLGQPLATDYGAVTRGLVYRNPITGLYYAESGNITVLATAHTALQGFLWLVNTDATIKAYIRSIGFVWSGTAATAFPTSPRVTVERVTFTGTPSGATITPAKRASTDAANTATLRTASTGLTLTAGAVIESFVVGSVLTAVGAVSVPEEEWQPTDDDALIVLGQNEGIVIRQPDAGTAADTRKIVMTLSWEER